MQTSVFSYHFEWDVGYLKIKLIFYSLWLFGMCNEKKIIYNPSSQFFQSIRQTLSRVIICFVLFFSLKSYVQLMMTLIMKTILTNKIYNRKNHLWFIYLYMIPFFCFLPIQRLDNSFISDEDQLEIKIETIHCLFNTFLCFVMRRWNITNLCYIPSRSLSSRQS